MAAAKCLTPATSPAAAAHGRRQPWRPAAGCRLVQHRHSRSRHGGHSQTPRTGGQPSARSSQGWVSDAASLTLPPRPSQDRPEDARLLPKATA